MMAKKSVQTRLETEISFTEFSYQLLQAYDFLYLFENHNVKLQMGGSDQWGNITTGIELIRKTTQQSAQGLTCPLITKADGTKFGKSEQGNVWLDISLTSAYKFYQFWLNSSDLDAIRYQRIFSLKPQIELETAEKQALENPHLRIPQKNLASELTERIHGQTERQKAQQATALLFGNEPIEALKNFSNKEIQDIFDGVPQSIIQRTDIEQSINIIDFLVSNNVAPSKTEARKALKANSLSINKQKQTDENLSISTTHLINNQYILIQNGKKNYHLITIAQ